MSEPAFWNSLSRQPRAANPEFSVMPPRAEFWLKPKPSLIAELTTLFTPWIPTATCLAATAESHCPAADAPPVVEVSEPVVEKGSPSSDPPPAVKLPVR
ncbi:hypothetical protein D3C87_1948080 [compost metagenome]